VQQLAYCFLLPRDYKHHIVVAILFVRPSVRNG